MVTTTTAGLLLWKFVVAGAILLAGGAIGSWLSGVAALGLDRSGLDPMVRRGLARAVRPIVGMVAVVAALEYLDVDLTIVAAIVGATTLALGLALRGPLSNVANGGVLLTLRPFREGEWISCAGEHGRVLEQSTFAVVIERADGTVVTIPNEVAFAAPIHNHSRRGHRRLEVAVVLPHDVDLADTRSRLLAVVAADPRILPSPEPAVRIDTIERDGVRVVVQVWVLAASHDAVKADLTEGVLGVVAPAPVLRRSVS